MDINQISTDLMNLAFLGNNDEDDPIFEQTNDELELDNTQPVEMPIEAVASEKQGKNISTIEDDDLAKEARRGILEKYKSKSSPHLLADSCLPLASSSPRNTENSRQQDTGKLMYSSEAQVKNKKKSWFGKRKPKSKTKSKGLKKLSEDTKLTIKNMGKLNGKRSKAAAKADHAEIPTVIKLKKVTRPVSDIPKTKEKSGLDRNRDDRNASFTDSISTLSHHVHEDRNTWIEQGVSGLLSNMFSMGNEDGPTVKDAKGQAWKIYIDDKTGLTYYENPVTRSTTWTNPTEDTEKVGAIDNQKETTVSKPSMNPISEGRPASPFDMKAMKPLLDADTTMNDSESGDEECSTVVESNADTVTKFSDSDAKRSKRSTETDDDNGTHDDTHGSISTGLDGTWIERRVSTMLDTQFILDGDGDDETLFGSLVSEQASKESKVSKAESDDSKLARKPHSLRQSFPTTDAEKPLTAPQRNDPLVVPEAEGDKKNSSDARSAAGATWFGNLVAMMSHDEEEDDTKTAVKIPAPQSSEPWYSIQLVSSIDGLESTMPAASTGNDRDAVKSDPANQSTSTYTRPRSFSDPGSPNRDSRKLENGKKEDKKPANGNSFLYNLYNTVMSEDEAEDIMETPPLSTHWLRGREDRTLTGMTGITGASVFSGITGASVFSGLSDDGPLREQLAAKPESLLNDGNNNEESVGTESVPAKPGEYEVLTTSSRDPNEVNAEIKVTANKKSGRSPWRAILDPQTGRTYYFHRMTRQRSWTKPDDFDDCKKPSFYWGIAHKDSTSVGPPSPPKGSTIVRDEAQSPVLGSSEMEVSNISSSLDISSDKDLEMVDIIDNGSYDPTAAIMVAPSFRSTPNTEVGGGKGQSRSKEPCDETPVLEGKKSRRNPFSWRREPGSEKDNEEINREQDERVARLLAEVESRIDPTAAEDYSYVSGYAENDVDRSIPEEESVLSTVAKNPTGLSPHIGMNQSRSNEASRTERVNSKLMDGTSDSNSLNRDAEAFNTEPKRGNLLQRFKPKFRKNVGKGKSDDAKTSGSGEERKTSVTAAKVSSNTESKVPVYAEIDTERDPDQTGKEAKSAGTRAKRPSKAIKGAGKKKSVRKRSTPWATASPAVPPETKKPPAVSKHRKKGDFTDEQESPASVLHFEKVGEEEPTKDVATTTKRRVWKSVVDPASGRTYFYHRITRQTTWTEPEDLYESVESTDIRGDRNDRESVSCKLDEKFALVDDKEDVDVVKSVRPKHKEAAKFKREPSFTKSSKNLEASLARAAQTDSAMQPPVYSKPANQWSVSTEAAQQPYVDCVSADELKTSIAADVELLGQVVDSPLEASLRMRDELGKVTTQLFQQFAIVDSKESSQLESKSKSSAKESSRPVALPNAAEESPYQAEGIDADELSRPEDEIRGTLANPKEDSVVNDSRVDSKEESTLDTTFSSRSLETQIVDKKLQETLWEDLLLM